jgi:hypothetical protein
VQSGGCIRAISAPAGTPKPWPQCPVSVAAVRPPWQALLSHACGSLPSIPTATRTHAEAACACAGPYTRHRTWKHPQSHKSTKHPRRKASTTQTAHTARTPTHPRAHSHRHPPNTHSPTSAVRMSDIMLAVNTGANPSWSAAMRSSAPARTARAPGGGKSMHAVNSPHARTCSQPPVVQHGGYCDAGCNSRSSHGGCCCLLRHSVQAVGPTHPRWLLWGSGG